MEPEDHYETREVEEWEIASLPDDQTSRSATQSMVMAEPNQTSGPSTQPIVLAEPNEAQTSTEVHVDPPLSWSTRIRKVPARYGRTP